MHVETVTLSAAESNALRSEIPFGTMGSANFRGRSITDKGDGVFSYYGSNADCAEFLRLILKIKRAAGARPSQPTATETIVAVDPPATPAQIRYLTTLTQQDPAAAMAIGASDDGNNVRAGLTKAAASRAITALKEGL